ncbi:hypothetical protein L207DRAFT_638723 [Hyaloscypha variabilis F]|uniref:Tat pathway signal sequence n=1 Tax=Hyaloscypha variabilis (strain UAMH 11265 / GT02V1 / F) TaxID=1149755 RepID=A0A2J6R6P7_HYAVF|nr:hypothetical protein L207DRAFT_638723 [Hyaloscypha variabilis F]
MYSQEYEKLHNAADESQETLLESNIPIEKLHKCFSLRKALAIHACVLSFYTVLALLAWRLSMQSFCASTKYGNGTYTPATKAIENKLVTIDIDSPNPYHGNPNTELDQAWDDLLHGYNIRIPEHALHSMGRKSIPLADGSGDSWGILAATHNLHCLREIRHYLAPDFYPNNRAYSMKEGMVYEPHIDHCLESLRQYVMCKADATILTWYWPDEPPRESGKYYPQTDYRFQQQCVNWEKLRAWEVSNSFQLSPETIFHPIYGYPW